MELLPETCNKWKDEQKILDSFGRGPVSRTASVVVYVAILVNEDEGLAVVSVVQYQV